MIPVREYERELHAALGYRPGQNMNQGEMGEYQTALAQANDKLTAAEQELNGMREMKREHQSDLREAHGQLDTAQQNLKLKEDEKRRRRRRKRCELCRNHIEH